MKHKFIILLPLILIFTGCAFSDYKEQYNKAKEVQAEQDALKAETRANIDDYYVIFGTQPDSCNFDNLAVGEKVVLGSFWTKTNGITSVEGWPVKVNYNLTQGKIHGIVKLEKDYVKQGVSEGLTIEDRGSDKIPNNYGDFILRDTNENEGEIDEFYYLTYTPSTMDNFVSGGNTITTTFLVDQWLITANEETEEPVPAETIITEGEMSITCSF